MRAGGSRKEDSDGRTSECCDGLMEREEETRTNKCKRKREVEDGKNSTKMKSKDRKAKKRNSGENKDTLKKRKCLGNQMCVSKMGEPPAADSNDCETKGMRCDCLRVERRIRRDSGGNLSVIRGRFGNITNRLQEERQREVKDKLPGNMRVEYMGQVAMSRSRFELMKKYILRETPRPLPRRTIGDGGLEWDFKRDIDRRTGVTTRKMYWEDENRRITEARCSLNIVDDKRVDEVKTGSLEWKCDELRLYPLPNMTKTSDPSRHLSRLHSVKMLDAHLLKVVIEGKNTLMYVDNGCTSCFIRYEHAQELGIFKYTVDRLQVQLFMWSHV